MDTKAVFFVVIAVSGIVIYQASNWWERAYASYEYSELSPDGCIRVDTYKPFWVLPSLFHQIPNPDPTVQNDLGVGWDAAIFKRAFEAETGAFLGETVVYDPFSQKFMDWGDTRKPGWRVVTANGFSLVESSRCSDEATLARLEAAYEKMRGTNP